MAWPGKFVVGGGRGRFGPCSVVGTAHRGAWCIWWKQAGPGKLMVGVRGLASQPVARPQGPRGWCVLAAAWHRQAPLAAFNPLLALCPRALAHHAVRRTPAPGAVEPMAHGTIAGTHVCVASIGNTRVVIGNTREASFRNTRVVIRNTCVAPLGNTHGAIRNTHMRGILDAFALWVSLLASNGVRKAPACEA